MGHQRPAAGADATRRRPEIHGLGELVELYGDGRDFVIQYYGDERNFPYDFRQRAWQSIERLRGQFNPLWSFYRYRDCFGAWPLVVSGELVDPPHATMEQKRTVYEQLLTTARASGVIIIDVDQGGDYSHLGLVATVAANTGNAGLHLFYRCAETVGNSAGKLGPHIDTRGDGGQAVFPGSVHPETGEMYEWVPGMEPWTVEVAELPAGVLALLRAEKAPRKKTDDVPRMKVHRWAMAALQKEIDAVARSVEGQRNTQLNTSAFSLGQLVGGGYLERSGVEAALLEAARVCGLPDNEARTTLASGLDGGMAKPRTYEPNTPDPALESVAVAAASQGYLLKPGPHLTADGEYVEQSGDSFAAQVVEKLPADCIYRKDLLPGLVFGETGQRRWDEMGEADAMLLMDRHVRCGRWVKSREGKQAGEKGDPVIRYEVATTLDARLVLARAKGTGKFRELNLMVNYPVYGPGWELVAPGWRDGLYYDEPPELQGLAPDRDCQWIHNVLYDLVVDFPFRSAADRENFFGLLLTPIIAPALEGNRPLHLVHASLERTGKSKLAGDVFGGIIMGRPTPAMQITEREDEREKRILSLLLRGETLIHLDNLPGFIDSPSLSSLLTARVFSGRLLGQSKQIALPNYMTVVGSGNNVQFTGEVAKRIVPIMLQAMSARPETRRDFQHQDLTAFVRQQRREVLACLLGMVENWKAAGRPLCPNRLGGFEEWSGVVGGILALNTFKKWRSNESQWRSQADPRGSELEDFVAAWAEKYGRSEVRPDELLDLAKANDLFGQLTCKPAAAVSFGRILQRHRDTPVGEFFLRHDRKGGRPVHWLEPIA